MKKFALIIFIVALLAFIKFGLVSDSSPELNNQLTEDENQANNLSGEVSEEKLSINSKTCIGCGKCIKIAPDNFIFNQEARVAEVKSQIDIYNNNVSEAIQRCPVSAIKIS